ncbi:MAG: hypothetical protein WD512_00315 [Candidatus Paceibacterota bacterium]
MARILGFTYGELRGKIGGTVYSRNKSGAYARAKVTPVNPQTVRQQTARYSFGNNSILFQNLSVSAKDCWETFARTHFNPLKGNSTGIYSGGNAFVALRSSINQGNNYKTVPSGTQGILGVTFTSEVYPVQNEPPAEPTSSTIVDFDSNAYPIELIINSISSIGEIDFGIFLAGISPTAGTTYSSFINAEGQQFGIGFYMSNNLKFMGAKPNTALKLNFADTGLITNIEETVSGDPVAATLPLNIVLDPLIDKANIRDFPCVDDIILVTPFIRSAKGAQKLMTPQYITVT